MSQGESLSFAELERRVNAAAHLLWSLGVRPGDRVAALLPNGFAMVELLFAAARTGAVLCPLSPRAAPAELSTLLADCRPRLLVAGLGLVDGLAEVLPRGTEVLPEGSPDDARPDYGRLRDAAPTEPFVPPVGDEAPWLLVYTSGTTGRPKGVLRSQRSDFLLGILLASALGVGPDDVGFAALPLFHVNAIWFVTLSLCLGIACHLHAPARFQPGRFAEALEQSGATYASLVPTLLDYLAQEASAGRVRGDALRLLLTSSAPLPAAVRQRLLASLPRVRLAELYGATELGAVTLEFHTGAEPAGSVGFPLPGVRVRLLDGQRREVSRDEVGELFVDSPLVLQGFFGRRADTEAARAPGYVSAGDLARRDASGRLYLVDRVADTIITSGENVYPSEVEEALLAHPAVAQAAVIGVPDPRRGEAVAAVVVLREGARVGAADLAAHCRQRLAGCKCPRHFAFAEALPLLPTGKVARRLVREHWRTGTWGGRETP